MNYNIESVIKRLQDAQKAGKTIIDEKELINISTPAIKNIDAIISLIEAFHIKMSPFKKYKIPIAWLSEYTGLSTGTY